jgi:hypothetical protein
MITADGQDYFTCRPYRLSDDGGFSQTSYTISFKNSQDDDSGVSLRGVKKLTIQNLPEMVNLKMPSVLPNIKTDRLATGEPYKEGVSYTWQDGSQASIANGEWVAVKQRNPICGKR